MPGRFTASPNNSSSLGLVGKENNSHIVLASLSKKITLIFRGLQSRTN